MDFAAPWPQPLLEAMAELELGAGPPEPQVPPRARRMDAPALDAAAPLPTRRALAVQHRGRCARRAHRPRRRPTARRRSCATVCSSRWAWSTPPSPSPTSTGSAPATRTDPETGERFVFDPPDGQWAKPPAFPSGGGRPCVDARRPARVRAGCSCPAGGCPDGSRLLSRASIDAMTTDQIGVASGRARALARRLAGVGLRRRCAGAPHRSRAHHRVATAGQAASGASWVERPQQARSSASCSPPTCSPARSPRRRSSRTSGPARTPRSTTDQGGRHVIACSDTRSAHRLQRARRHADAVGGRRRRARIGRAVLDLDGAHRRASARHAATGGVAATARSTSAPVPASRRPSAGTTTGTSRCGRGASPTPTTSSTSS